MTAVFINHAMATQKRHCFFGILITKRGIEHDRKHLQLGSATG
jgi:hypothetical protein